jgi:hypothetical protein
MLASDAFSAADRLSLGGLILLLGLGLPMIVAADKATALLRAAAAVGASAQLAVLVAQGDFALLTWGLYGLLCAAFVWMAQREAALRRPTRAAVDGAGPAGALAASAARRLMRWWWWACWRCWRLPVAPAPRGHAG